MAVYTISNLSKLQEITKDSAGARQYPMTEENIHRMHKVLDIALAHGIKVGENIDPKYGGKVVIGVHSLEGMHYAVYKCPTHNTWHSGAADLNYGASGATERSMLDPLVAIAIVSGVRVLYGANVPGHANHAHLDTTPVSRSNIRFYNPKDLTWPGNAYPVFFSKALRKGESGTQVRFLQSMLRSLGATLTVDGRYGPATQGAVIDFQRKYGLVADGVAGAKTQTEALVRYCYWKIAQ